MRKEGERVCVCEREREGERERGREEGGREEGREGDGMSWHKWESFSSNYATLLWHGKEREKFYLFAKSKRDKKNLKSQKYTKINKTKFKYSRKGNEESNVKYWKILKVMKK